ncbi:hypothetical protein ACH40F_35850 [Streptomyces sp. NPDC020794]|uniref:hypothetical protein n=1 Tax=unclassified Streptomyces TaxID=2593676 RepID=UPI0036EAE1AF
MPRKSLPRRLAANAKSSSVSYQVNEKKVKAGDILTVQGKVALPKGVEPGGTEVYPRTYWEDEAPDHQYLAPPHVTLQTAGPGPREP